MRDYRGAMFGKIQDPLIRDSIMVMDYWIHDASRGFARIQQGQTPDGSGNPLGGPSLLDYLFLPGRPGGQIVHAVDGSPVIGVDTLGAGTSVIGDVGTPMYRGSYSGTTLFDLLPILFNGGVYDTAIRPNNGGFQVISTDGTAGLRLVPSASRTYIQAGRLDSGGNVLNADMTIGGLGASYGNSLSVAFLQNYFEGAAATAPRIGFGVGTGSLTANPSAFGANWRGVLLAVGKSATEPAITMSCFDGTTGAPGWEFRSALTGASPTQGVGTRKISTEYDGTAGQGRLTLWGTDAVRAGYLMPTNSAISGTKVSIFDRNGSRALALDSGTGFWADSKTITFLEVGQSISSFKAVTLSSLDAAVMDRFHITALNTLLSDAGISGSTVVPGALLHLRNTASASKVLLRLQPHGSQSTDILQIRDAVDAFNIVSVDSAGILNANRAVLGTFGSGVKDVVIPTAASGTGPGGLYLDDGTFSIQITVPSAGLTGNQIIALPDGSGTLLSAAVDGAVYANVNSVFRTNTASQGAAFRDTTNTSKILRFILSGASANNHSITLTNSAARNYGLGNLGGNIAIVGDQTTAVSAGRMEKVDLTAQGAAIAATNLTNSPPAGYYVVHYTIEDTTADVTAGTIQFQINYTDDVGATNQTGPALAMTAQGRDRGSFQVQLASGNITYQTNLVGIFGAAKYSLYVRTVFMG